MRVRGRCSSALLSGAGGAAARFGGGSLDPWITSRRRRRRRRKWPRCFFFIAAFFFFAAAAARRPSSLFFASLRAPRVRVLRAGGQWRRTSRRVRVGGAHDSDGASARLPSRATLALSLSCRSHLYAHTTMSARATRPINCLLLEPSSSRRRRSRRRSRRSRHRRRRRLRTRGRTCAAPSTRTGWAKTGALACGAPSRRAAAEADAAHAPLAARGARRARARARCARPGAHVAAIAAPSCKAKGREVRMRRGWEGGEARALCRAARRASSPAARAPLSATSVFCFVFSSHEVLDRLGSSQTCDVGGW